MHAQKSSKPVISIALFLLLLLSWMGLMVIPYVWKFVIRSYPSTTQLAKQYFYAVVDGNEQQAAHLASSGCQDLVRNEARKDVRKFGGTEVRNVIVKVEDGTGSDTEIEFAFVNFEYRKDSQAEWQAGKVSVMTDFEGMGLRHLICGG